MATLDEAYLDIRSRSVQDCVDILRQIITVKKLWLRISVFYEIPLEGIAWKFENLREAHLTINFAEHSSIISIFSLSRCSPYVEDLTIEVLSWLIDELDEVQEDFLNSAISDNLFTSLKYVSLSGIDNLSKEIMCFVKFLLSKTESLQTFVVTFTNHESNEWYVNVRAELDAFARASPHARLEVKHRDKPMPSG